MPQVVVVLFRINVIRVLNSIVNHSLWSICWIYGQRLCSYIADDAVILALSLEFLAIALEASHEEANL